MNQSVQQVAANAEESASSAEELAGQSHEMLAMIKEFQVGTEYTSVEHEPSSIGPSFKANNGPASKRIMKQSTPVPPASMIHGKADAGRLIPFNVTSEALLKEF
jgi:hypothetical protein